MTFKQADIMAKEKYNREAELIKAFGLKRVVGEQTPEMQAWLAVEMPVFDVYEQALWETICKSLQNQMAGWAAPDIKMKFIAPLLRLAKMQDTATVLTFFDRKMTGKVEGIRLNCPTDFMVATGILNLVKKPFFHYQQYKPLLKPYRDPMAQLLTAMLITQATTATAKPIYGCEIVDKEWNFVVLSGKTYCISKGYYCLKKEDLLQIIAILRKFRHILETELLD